MWFNSKRFLSALSPLGWLLVAAVACIPFQRAYVYIFPQRSFAHTATPYNWVKYAYFDALLVLLFPFVVRRAKELTQERAPLVLLAFLALCLLSIATHAYGTLLLPGWFFFKIAATSLLFFGLVVESNGNTGARLFKVLQYTIVVAAALQAAIALAQFFTQASVGLKCLGEGSISALKHKGSGFNVDEGSRWFLDTCFHLQRTTSFLIRSQGTLDHPNHLGIVLVTGLAALTNLFLKAGKRGRRAFAPLFFLLLMALFTTFSRASFFTWLIFVTLTTALLKKQALPLVKLLAPLFLLCALLFYPQIQKRGGLINSTPVSAYANQERISYQNDALTMIKAHPLKGVGFHNYVATIDAYSVSPQGAPLIVHNIFLLVFAELGLGGIALFLIFWLLLLHRGWAMRSDTSCALWGILLFSYFFYGGCDVFFLTDQQGQLTLFLTFGMVFLSSTIARETAKDLSRV